MSAPFTLEGAHVRLEPLSLDHVDELLEAATGDRSTFTYTLVPSDRPAMTAYVERALGHAADGGDQVPFATRSLALGPGRRRHPLLRARAVGLDGSGARGRAGAPRRRPRPGQHRPHLARPAAQRTPVNTEAKLLMLGPRLRVVGRAGRPPPDRLPQRPVAGGHRPARLLPRRGAAVDRPAPDGAVRHSAIFSMTADEWPAARRRLEERLRPLSGGRWLARPGGSPDPGARRRTSRPVRSTHGRPVPPPPPLGRHPTRTATPLVGPGHPGRGLPGPVHGGARRLHRERGAAGHPARPGVQPDRTAVGGDRLRPDLRRPAPPRGTPGRPVRPAAHLPARPRRCSRRPASSAASPPTRPP